MGHSPDDKLHFSPQFPEIRLSMNVHQWYKDKKLITYLRLYIYPKKVDLSKVLHN